MCSWFSPNSARHMRYWKRPLPVYPMNYLLWISHCDTLPLRRNFAMSTRRSGAFHNVNTSIDNLRGDNQTDRFNRIARDMISSIFSCSGIILLGCDQPGSSYISWEDNLRTRIIFSPTTGQIPHIMPYGHIKANVSKCDKGSC